MYGKEFLSLKRKFEGRHCLICAVVASTDITDDAFSYCWHVNIDGQSENRNLRIDRKFQYLLSWRLFVYFLCAARPISVDGQSSSDVTVT